MNRQEMAFMTSRVAANAEMVMVNNEAPKRTPRTP